MVKPFFNNLHTERGKFQGFDFNNFNIYGMQSVSFINKYESIHIFFGSIVGT
jgi:hypothetical protein